MQAPPHPWRKLRAWTHVVVHHVELGPGLWGATDGFGLIWLDSRLGQVERRCALAHEMEYIRRGHTGCQDEQTERTVDAAAARQLLPDSASSLRHSCGSVETWRPRQTSSG